MRDVGAPSAIRTATVPCDSPDAVDRIAAMLGPDPHALVLLFVSPEADIRTIARRARQVFPLTDTVACTTAGEIGPGGYVEHQIMAIALPARSFAAQSVMIRDLDRIEPVGLVDRLIQQRTDLAQRAGHFENEFAFIVIDGLSRREDAVVAAVVPALGHAPLFGGSAGDGTRFQHTTVALNGDSAENAAVLTFVRTECRTKVFSLDHLIPGGQRMVVTDADPEARIVKTINAEPAAREYARIVGKDPNQLDEFTFAAHPVVVRLGDRHHVRSIQRVNEKGELVFFSAIDEGVVLTVAEGQDMAEHLDRELAALSADTQPMAIIGCDCILRRIEAEQSQSVRALSDVLARHGVVGFCTYGEQIGPMHVNQTMTGVAIYPPDDPGGTSQ